MGRIDNWVDKDQQRKDASREVIEEQDMSVNVYRQTGNSRTVGFSSEVGDAPLLRTIRVRIDLAKETDLADQSPDAGDEARYYALSDDFDVMLNDVWEYYDMGGTRRVLRVVRVEANELGNMVWLNDRRSNA